MSEELKLLPLGSIVVLKGGYRKYMIVSRGLQVNVNNQNNYFDYGACMYPEGLIGDQIMYFQHVDINKVIFEGFADADNELMVENIKLAYDTMKLTHADTMQLKNRE